MSKDKWTDMIIELQSLAQAGLTYGRDDFDLERYARIRDIAAEMMSDITDIPKEKVRDLFCGDSGYQTPKIDTRAAIFKDGRILLVHERNGLWSLPGGWCELFLSVSENTVKEESMRRPVFPPKSTASSPFTIGKGITLPTTHTVSARSSPSATSPAEASRKTSRPPALTGLQKTNFRPLPLQRTAKSRYACALRHTGQGMSGR